MDNQPNSRRTQTNAAGSHSLYGGAYQRQLDHVLASALRHQVTQLPALNQSSPASPLPLALRSRYNHDRSDESLASGSTRRESASVVVADPSFLGNDDDDEMAEASEVLDCLRGEKESGNDLSSIPRTPSPLSFGLTTPAASAPAFASPASAAPSAPADACFSGSSSSFSPLQSSLEEVETEPFPTTIRRMLEETTMAGLQHIVSFSPSDQTFSIHKRQSFVKFVLPRYFPQLDLATLERRLMQVYGFFLVEQGADSAKYHHTIYLRDGHHGYRYKTKQSKSETPAYYRKHHGVALFGMLATPPAQ